MSSPLFLKPLLFSRGFFYFWPSLCFALVIPLMKKLIASISLCFLVIPSGKGQELYPSPKGKKNSFSHQYTFLNQDHYTFIDTSFQDLRWYRALNNELKDQYGKLVLTNIGGAQNRLILPELGSIYHFQGLGPYDSYFRQKQDIPFYQVRSPLTEARYIAGFNRGQVFNIYHTQNVHERWNFLIDYKRLNSLGFYTNNQNKQASFLANTHYLNPQRNYEIWTYFESELLEIQEFGGLTSDSLFENNVQTERTLLPTNLGTARDLHVFRNREWFIKQEFDIAPLLFRSDSSRSERFLGLGLEYTYSRRSQTYQGNSNDYYANYFRTNQAYTDSFAYHQHHAYAYLKGQVGDTNAVDVQAGVRSFSYRYENQFFRFDEVNWALSGTVRTQLWDRLKLNGALDYFLIGALQNNYEFKGEASIRLIDKLEAFGSYQNSQRFPSPFQQFYWSNNFIWKRDYDPIISGILKYGLRWPQGGLSLKNFNANNWVYWDAEALPQQSGTAVKYFQADAYYNLSLWDFLHFDNRATYQAVSSGAEVLPLPEYLFRSSLYFEFSLFKKAARCLVGADVNYFSAFQSPSYSPALGRFYNAAEKTIGNYPYIDLFAQFKVAKAHVFLKYQHVNQGLLDYNYFAAPAYPLNDRVFRVGLTWRFFN